MSGATLSAQQWVAVLTVGISAAASGVQVATQAQDMRQAFAALSSTQERRDLLLGEYSRLLLERGMLSSYRNVGDTAANALDMRFPEEFTAVRRARR